MIKNDIKQTYGENITCDFKEAVERKQPKSWLKSVSAFANTVGGVLVFGVNDDGETIGLENAKADAEFISDRIKVFMDPVPEFELITKPAGNGHFLLELHVSAGEMTPYYYVNSGTHSAFIRIGDESVIANAHQLSALVLKGRNRTYDSLVTEYHLGELTFDTLAKTYQKQTGLPFEDKLLQSFSLVTDDGLLTQAGVLFSDQCPYRHSSLYCTRWNGLEKDDALDSREYQGNLLTLLDAGVQFMTLHNKKGWIKLPNRRLDTPDYSDRALFEALVNALIHRDYSELGSEVHIDIYDNRLVIYSPGGMFDGSQIQNRDVNEVPSRRRNPILADVFTQFGYMEKRGSGLRKIRNETAKLPGFTDEKRPTFRSQYESFFTEILNNNYRDESQGEVQNDTHDDMHNVSVNVSEDVSVKILIDILADHNITAIRLAEKHSVTARQIYRILAQLQKENKIVRIGSDKNGHWEITKEGHDVVKDVSVNVSEDVSVNVSEDVSVNVLNDIIADSNVTAAKLAEKYSLTVRQIYRILAHLQKENKIIRVGSDKTGHWEVTCPPNVPQDGSVNVSEGVSVNAAQNVADVVKNVAVKSKKQ